MPMLTAEVDKDAVPDDEGDEVDVAATLYEERRAVPAQEDTEKVCRSVIDRAAGR